MDTLRIGFAQENITPEPVGFYLDGYGFRNRPADSVRFLRCQLAGMRVVVRGIDLHGLEFDQAAIVKLLLGNVLGIIDRGERTAPGADFRAQTACAQRQQLFKVDGEMGVLPMPDRHQPDCGFQNGFLLCR